MFSYGEIFVVLAAAVALIGPKDMPIIARTTGRLVGKAIGYIQSARGQLDDVMKHSQVDQVHKELQETMAQLEAIRHEIRSGISITKPSPFTRSVLNAALDQDSPTQAQAVANVKQSPSLPVSTDSIFGSQTGPVSATQVVVDMQEQATAACHQTPSHFQTMSTTSCTKKVADSTILMKPVGFHPGHDGTFDTMPASTGRIAGKRVLVRPIGVQPAPLPQPSAHSGEGLQDITVLPISALSAGLLRPNTGPLSGGVELVLECVIERKVAFDALEFFQQTGPTLK